MPGGATPVTSPAPDHLAQTGFNAWAWIGGGLVLTLTGLGITYAFYPYSRINRRRP